MCMLLCLSSVICNIIFVIADLPSFISGNIVGILDPHKRYFINEKGDFTSSYCWDLMNDHDEICELHDQFAPYKQEIFNISQKVFDSGYYKGTLFRFPLRSETKQSHLGSTYTFKKVYNLFDSIITERDLLLLFMKNLCEISIYDRSAAGIEELVFNVKIDAATNAEMLAKRNRFLEAIQSSSVSKPIETSYVVESSVNQRDVQNKSNKWLIQQYFDSEQNAKRVKNNSNLGKNLPWVSTAVCITDIENESLTSDSGRIFCFLPLPSDTKKATGLKFHVNGYFSVDQNRRHIKWPTMELVRSQITDPELLWNIYLVNELLPKALVLQFLAATKIFHQSSEKSKLLYNMLPIANDMLQPWKELVDAFYTLFVMENICYTPIKGGQWISIKSSVFDNLTKEPSSNLIKSILEWSEVNVACIPDHLLQTFTELSPASVTCVTAAIVRSSCKNRQIVTKLTQEDRLSLLSFLVSDCMYEDLAGLEFMPCVDGTVQAFRSAQDDMKNIVYLVDTDHPAVGIPNIASSLVNITQLSSGANEMRQIAASGKLLSSLLNCSVAVD